MSRHSWLLIYGKNDGACSRAIERIGSSVGGFFSTAVRRLPSNAVSGDLLAENDLIIIGTCDDNDFIRSLLCEKTIATPEKPQGYSAYAGVSAWNAEKDMVVVCGKDDAGVLYGATDFCNEYLAAAIFDDGNQLASVSQHAFFENPLIRRLPDWKKVSAPSVEKRGVWTWGHVIYDYKRFLDNLSLLKLNQIVIWNDHAPVNANEIVDYAHSLAIEVLWGFAWGWDTDCNVSMGMDEASVNALSDEILEKYEREYAVIKGDGIYFQSATELDSEYINGKLIAETVTELVNITAGKILSKYPRLAIQFGLHANSVRNRLDYIAKSDKRVRIVWENCGTFPFSDKSGKDLTVKESEFENTLAFTKKIAQLRSDCDNFGLVLKEMTFLDWTLFKHVPKTAIGVSDEGFIQKRTLGKRRLWRFIQANWLKNLKYLQALIKAVVNLRRDNDVEAVIEDGLLENEISLPAALYAQTLWDAYSDVDTTLAKVSLYPFVKFANV